MSHVENVVSDKVKLLEKWDTVKTALAEVKVEESKLRKEVLGSWFPTHKEEGSQNIDLDNGYKLNAIFGLNYEFDKERVKNGGFSYNLLTGEPGADLDELMQQLWETEDGRAIAAELFDVKIELKTSAYKKLPPSFRAMVNPYITIKEASTQLKIVAPKEGK